MIPLTLFTDIEEAVVRESKLLIDPIFVAERSDSKTAIRSGIHAVVTGGSPKQSTMGSCSMAVKIFIVCISSHPRSEKDRRSECLAMVAAVLNRFVGLVLKDENGSSLVGKPLELYGDWGQSSEDENFLSYTVPFSSSISWKVQEEIGEHDLKVKLQYEVEPGGVLAAEDLVG